MSSPSKLLIILTSLSSLFLLTFLAEILYLLHRRRRNLLEAANPALPAGDQSSNNTPTSKSDLLYFFLCWKNRVRVEPAAVGSSGSGSVEELPEISLEISEMMKLHGIYGPSRVLFTIKEEEREEMGSSERSSLGGERKIPLGEKLTMEECHATGESPEMAAIVGLECLELETSTPFSTPSASPPYYTPSPSPARETRVVVAEV
ncbi:hypothetical protein Ancab_031514 [Ancistrocladus abbreviatus]